MIRTQIQLPDPLYKRAKDVAILRDWSLAEVVRRALECYVDRFSDGLPSSGDWEFPVLDFGGDYLVNPAAFHVEAEVIEGRAHP